MVQLHFERNAVTCKIVFYGPGLSGKTTNLEVIHNKAPEDARGEMVSIATRGDRTLYFDFLPLDLGKVQGMDTTFQLYTVPGQIYYNNTRKLVLQGVDGVVFVADSSAGKIDDNKESLANLRDNLDAIGLNLSDVPVVIQYNKRDLPDAMPTAELEAHLNPDGWPSFEAVAKDGQGVFVTLKEIGRLVIERINTEQAAGAGRRRTANTAPSNSGKSPKSGPLPGVDGSATPLPPQQVRTPIGQTRTPADAPSSLQATRRHGRAPSAPAEEPVDLPPLETSGTATTPSVAVDAGTGLPNPNAKTQEMAVPADLRAKAVAVTDAAEGMPNPNAKTREMTLPENLRQKAKSTGGRGSSSKRRAASGVERVPSRQATASPKERHLLKAKPPPLDARRSRREEDLGTTEPNLKKFKELDQGRPRTTFLRIVVTAFFTLLILLVIGTLLTLFVPAVNEHVVPLLPAGLQDLLRHAPPASG
jgi:signal recognition particle receptor subunit beta